MKHKILMILFTIAVGIFSIGCWNPGVKSVPITAPWDSMNLPIKQNAIVWESAPTKFKAVHKESKTEIAGRYVDALKSQGWKLTNMEEKSSIYVYMEKDGRKLKLDVYDYENTGVIIELS